jgi:hypothetical protein
MDTSAMACEAKALQRSFLDEALSTVARAFAVNSTSRSLCRTGAMLPPGLRQRRQSVLSCTGR